MKKSIGMGYQMAKRGPKKGTGGRPIIPINWNVAETLARIQCTGEEIAAVLGIHYDTLQERCKKEFKLTFPEWFKRFSDGGKSSLRRSMWKMATGERPNAAMAIWLSKQYLGMKDNAIFDDENKPKLTLAYSSDYLKKPEKNEE